MIEIKQARSTFRFNKDSEDTWFKHASWYMTSMKHFQCIHVTFSCAVFSCMSPYIACQFFLSWLNYRIYSAIKLFCFVSFLINPHLILFSISLLPYLPLSSSILFTFEQAAKPSCPATKNRNYGFMLVFVSRKQ